MAFDKRVQDFCLLVLSYINIIVFINFKATMYMLRTSCIVPTDPVAHDKLRWSDLNTKSIASTLTDTSLKQPSHSQISTLFLPYILKIKIPEETPPETTAGPPRLVEKGQETKIWESLLHE